MSSSKKENYLICFCFTYLYFALNVTAQEKGCPCGRKEFYDISATIQSPEFPSNYPNECNCAYRIFTDRYINVKFETFEIEESDDCQYDFLNVLFDASSPTASPERYCGEGLGKVNDGTLRGKGPLIVGFKSDESDNLQGFSFTYEFEIQGPDPCLSEPCQNEGTCNKHAGYYMCDCIEGYAGVNCEIEKDECTSYPCKNQGDCIDELNSFTCQCNYGFTGELCQIKPELCSTDPCLNGGLCVERGLDFVCSCPRDFMGDTCETPVPTPAPPKTTPPKTTTTTTIPITTAIPITSRITPLNSTNNPPQDEEEPGSKNSGKVPENLTNTTKDSNDTEDQGQDKDNNTWTTIIIVVAILVALLILGAIAWYKWKHKRISNQAKKKDSPKYKRLKGESGKGRKGRRLSRTTSYNSVMMKSDGHDKIINQMTKMSEDIIMEEITGESQGSMANLNPVTVANLNQSKPFTNLDSSLDKNRNNIPNMKNIPLPLNQSGFETNNSNMVALPAGQQEVPYRIAPEDAVKLLNQMKQNNSSVVDQQSALDRYGYGSFPKHSIPSSIMSPPMQVKLSAANPVESIFHLPNVPIPTEASSKPSRNFNWGNAPLHNPEATELSPEEAAEVVNHFLQNDPSKRKTIDTRDAMDIIREVKRNRDSGGDIQFDREKSVIVHPQQVADLVNRYPTDGKHNMAPSDYRENGSVITSNYDIYMLVDRLSLARPSESAYRSHMKKNREFREYSPIQEESNGLDDEIRSPVNTQKRPSQNFEQEPELNPQKKKVKRFTYAKSIDPDEKVHDWLKKTPKQKVKHRNTISSFQPNSKVSQTLITRAFPVNQQRQSQSNLSKNLNKSTEDVNDSPHTIRQSRRTAKENPSSIQITENKAKSLVDKLVQAPARSSQNIVGPGLQMSRENAFVGESF